MLNGNLLSILPVSIVGLVLFYFLCKFIDFGTGLLKTWKNKRKYKSRIMADGLIRWIAELLGIVFVTGLDMILGLQFVLCGLTLSLFIYKETGSICENLAECGVPLPNTIKERLEIFNTNKDSLQKSDENNITEYID